MPIALNDVSRILFVHPFGIGDVLFTTPLVARVRRLAPRAKIDFLCNRRVYPVLEQNPDLDKVWILERDEFRNLWRQSKIAFFREAYGLYRQLREQRFELAFDLSLSDRFGFFLAAMGVKHRVGFRYRRRGRALNAWLPLNGYAGKHVAEHQMDLLALLADVPVNTDGKIDRRLRYNAREDAVMRASQMLKNLGLSSFSGLVGIAPGGGDSWGPLAPLKRWSPGHFARLCRSLRQRGHRLIFLGGASDVKIVQEVVKALGEPMAASFAGQCSVGESAALMTQCEFVVTNDGGLLHLAVAQDVPTVSFFGPTDDMVYGPYPRTVRHLVLSHQPECRPCYRNFRIPPCPYDKRCLEELSAEEALEKIMAWRDRVLGTPVGQGIA